MLIDRNMVPSSEVKLSYGGGDSRDCLHPSGFLCAIIDLGRLNSLSLNIGDRESFNVTILSNNIYGSSEPSNILKVERSMFQAGNSFNFSLVM
jgi:hypothetical protein